MRVAVADPHPHPTPRAMSFDARAYLGSDELRALVTRFVRRRVPDGEVDDVVQTILVAALEATGLPESREDVRRWVVGVARHKVADLHRRRGRAQHVELPETLASEDRPEEARSLARWATEQTQGNPDAIRTLDWMAREGSGEKLAHIAEEEALPAPQVRQRVSRLRRFMRAQWKAELAAVAAVVVAILVIWAWLRDPAPQPVAPAPELVPIPAPEVVPPPTPSPVERGRAVRELALRDCQAERWQRCLDGLDEAAELDPAGDEAPDVAAARERAEEALAPDEAETMAKPGPDRSSSARPTPQAPPPTQTTPPPPKRPPSFDRKKGIPKPQAPPASTTPSGMSSDFFGGKKEK